ncbi:MAG: DUF3558 family protein [Acidimicrobiia bacterium]
MVSKAAMVALAGLCALALAACSSGSSKATTTTQPATTVTSGPLTTPTDVAQKVDPCRLLTASEATSLVGIAVKRSAGGGPGSLYCKYAAATSAGAEVTVKVDASPAAARAGYPSWVQPIPGVANGLTVTQVSNLGDEASETRSGNVNDGIYVRNGAVLVKIGAYPAVSEAALRVAALHALSRV